jgi:hypothetical protein
LRTELRTDPRKEARVATLHGADGFVIRPDYEATVKQLGDAPRFEDSEFEFVWPDTVSGDTVGKFIYVPASEYDEVVAQLSGDYTVIPTGHEGPHMHKGDNPCYVILADGTACGDNGGAE